MPLIVRLALPKDLDRIDQIYNQAIAANFQTADTRPLNKLSRLGWFKNHPSSSYPISVILHDEKVIGWSSLSKYREGREALQRTAEISYYLDHDHLGKGYGSVLIEATVDKARSLFFENLVAILLDSNKPSIGILEKYGFAEWGRIPKAALIKNQLVDHLYYGLRLVP